MVSTYTTYTLDTKDMTATLNRVASQATTKRQVDYYNDNIGKVKTADDLLNNYQLYSYAMKAYGLEDMTYAKAFMKKVLTSDLSDTSSFANKLTDPRYKQMAEAFNFGASTDLTAQTGDNTIAMVGSDATDATTDEQIGLYQQSFTTEEDNAATATATYESEIGSVKSVDDLLGNSDLLDYVLKAHGLDPDTTSTSYLKQMLTSDLSDSTSFVNVNGSDADKALVAEFNFDSDGSIKATTADTDNSYYEANIGSVTSVTELTSDTRLFDYVKAAYGISSSITAQDFISSAMDSGVAKQDGLTDVMAQFNFQSDGTVASGSSAQTADQMDDTTTKYTANYNTSSVQTLAQRTSTMTNYNTVVPSFLTSVGAADDAAYYKANIGSITSVDQLTSDDRLFNYVKIAYGLETIDAHASDATLKYDFAQAVENPTYASLTGLSSVVAQFNFQSDGSVASGEQAQDSDAITSAASSYSSNYQTTHDTEVSDAAANYRTRISNVKNIKDFFKTNATADSDSSNDNLPELYQMALRSYGIGEDEISTAQMKKILESDPYDSTSYVSKTKDSRFIALAKAFNFDSNGDLKQPVQALSSTQVNSYISDYTSNEKRGLSGTALTTATATIKTAATYFATNITKVTSVSGLLADSKLTDFILNANGIDPKTVTKDTLKKAFASDPSDSKSFVNTDAGSQFKSIVEAFNFDTKGNLTDSKLGVAQNKGALESTNDLYLHQTLEEQEGDTDDGVRLALYFQRKASSVNSVYDIMADSALYSVVQTTYSLPSSMSSMDVDAQAKLLEKVINVDDLHNSTKLNSLMQRFSVMYDLANGNSSSTSPALSILQGSSGVSADTLLSIAQLSSG